MKNGILIWYDEEFGELSLSSQEFKGFNQSKMIWCLPCGSTEQEKAILAHVVGKATHNYLINLSQNSSMGASLLQMFPVN